MEEIKGIAILFVTLSMTFFFLGVILTVSALFSRKKTSKPDVIDLSFLASGLFLCIICSLVMIIWYRSTLYSQILCWSAFLIFGVLGPVMIVGGMNEMNNALLDSKKDYGIVKIMEGIVFAGLAWAALAFWIKPAGAVRTVIEVAVFIYFIIQSISLFAVSAHSFKYVKNNENWKKIAKAEMWEGVVSAAAALAVAVYGFRSVHIVSQLFGWSAFSVLVILCPGLIWYGIQKKFAHRGKGETIWITAGLLAAGLAWLVLERWIRPDGAVYRATGWVMFGTLGILCLMMLVWGIVAAALHHEKKEGIIVIAGGLIAAGLAWLIADRWLHSAGPVLQAAETALFWLLGIAGILATLLGILFFALHRNTSGFKSWPYVLAGGIAGAGAAYALGSFALHLPWLHIDSFWNPFVVLPLSAAALSAISGLIVNFAERSAYRGGGEIARSHEWRVRGSNAKLSDATVRDVYDHYNGRGSWQGNIAFSMGFWRTVCALISAFGLGALLLLTDLETSWTMFQTTVNDFNSFTVIIKIILCALLLLSSGLVELICKAVSKY